MPPSPARAATAAAAEEPAIDGRRARRDRNRDAVLDAVIELFTEGHVGLVAADVAERSGVSLRSVYRYFDDLDELARAAIARQTERFAPLAEIPDLGEGPLDDRIERIVTSRVDIHDAVGPTRRAAIQRSATNPILAEQLERTRRLLAEQVAAQFAPELEARDRPARARLGAALELLLTFESVDQLRRVQGLGAADTRRVLAESLTRLLA
ncbi:MAG: TetR/AcrR family transcriptional regulator [Acidimicrobiales bacterium]|nr:TetR/AcrR family transcriptional regulator [Acidimicrobiales bacterium]MCB1263994.1 TetR/AcrR family transcriptional regulator [Mycobacterium sp.]MCB9372991.1 TetR/AcrR family transcriptional regulator [Microthrixaceae bacterium]